MTAVHEAEKTVPGRRGGARRSGRIVLTYAWLFVTLNYVYCDIFSLMEPGSAHHASQGALMGATALMQIPMGMIAAARLLPFRANRLANIAVGALMTIIQAATLFTGPAPHYIFSSVIEIAGTVFIAWYAWKWRR